MCMDNIRYLTPVMSCVIEGHISLKGGGGS